MEMRRIEFCIYGYFLIFYARSLNINNLIELFQIKLKLIDKPLLSRIFYTCKQNND